MIEKDETCAKHQAGPQSDKNDEDTVKLLGITWSITSDEYYRVAELNKDPSQIEYHLPLDLMVLSRLYPNCF